MLTMYSLCFVDVVHRTVEGLVGYPLGNRVRLLTSLITGISIAFAYSPEIGGIAITCVFFMLIAGALQVCCCAKKKTVQHTTGPSPATIMEQVSSFEAKSQALYFQWARCPITLIILLGFLSISTQGSPRYFFCPSIQPGEQSG